MWNRKAVILEKAGRMLRIFLARDCQNKEIADLGHAWESSLLATPSTQNALMKD